MASKKSIAQGGARELLEIMLHPVRMRVLTALAGSQGMTALQLAGLLPDVPQATLYRHINRLAKGGLLVVVEQRPVRGTLEKVFAINRAAGEKSSQGDALQALNSLSRQEHMRFFSAFLFTLLDDFARYLDQTPRVDMLADGVGYQKMQLHVSDAEMEAFAMAVQTALAPYFSDAPGRKNRLLSTIMLPEVSGPLQGDENE